MDARLQGILVVGTLFFAGLLLWYLIRKKLHLKYCLIWIFAIIAMLIAAIFPEYIKGLANMMGVKTPSNLIFVLYGLFMLLIVFTLTAIVSHMNIRIFRLIQYQALMEERLRRLEKKQEEETEYESRHSNLSGN